jgi:aminobenzoyl-glutamate utilization protein B
MVRDGAFDDVDIAISWHPACFAGVNEPVSLANTRIDFTFTGRAAHAAASPHLGRSALDAVELMNVGVNYMREHMPSDARIHYAYLDAGGIAPNVVQARAKVRYLIRAASVLELRGLVERVRRIADGAALMTETQVQTEVVSAVCELLGNTPLEAAMQRNLDRIGPPVFAETDRGFAQAIQDTLTDADIAAAYRRHGLQARRGNPLHDSIVAPAEKSVAMVGSTDVGDVSQKVPTVQARGATWAVGTPFHSWQAVAQGKSPAAHAAMAHVAKVMAGTALDALRDPALIAAAKEDMRRRMGGRPYESPLPADAKPALSMSTVS